MAELRSIDPRALIPNPANPRRTATPKAMDDQLVASILAIGIIQPPRVVETEAGLQITAGNRRRDAAVAAGLVTIEVLVCAADAPVDAMRSVSENLIRASMTSVDVWRATEALEAQGWTETAIADALALPARTVRRLKLLAHLLPAMLDVMAKGDMPNEDQLRTISAASRDEQSQVWKKHKPKKGEAIYWHVVANALDRRRMPFLAARFDDALAKSYGVTWEDDLFAPADEDGRYTTNVDGFLGAQQEWMQNSLPERGTLLPTNQFGQPELPKKAEHVHGKPGKSDFTGHYIDARTGAVKTLVYRIPQPAKPAKKGADGAAAAGEGQRRAGVRADVTQKGVAIIGDLRTDALHDALKTEVVDDQTLIALLVLALAGRNVTVQSGASLTMWDREEIAATIAEGGVLTADADLIRKAARSTLVAALSCRVNGSNSGFVARVAGDAINAVAHMPTMATDAFLSCLSKAAVETAAAIAAVKIEPRGNDTRAGLAKHYAGTTYVHPFGVFALSEAERAKAADRIARRFGAVAVVNEDGDGEDKDGGVVLLEEGEDVDAGHDDEAVAGERKSAVFAQAAE